jgi:phage repressor protein C with HTH and peptisase S24 domain
LFQTVAVVVEAPNAPPPGLGGRIRTVRGELSQQEFGDRLATSAQTIGRYERDERSPDAAFLRALMDRFGIDPRWLVTGEGEMALTAPSPVVAPGGHAGVPVMGLAECGLRGWYQRDLLAVTASRPGDFVDPEGFAVMAIGQSMVPAGIVQGQLCFCSPRTPPSVGDAVYVERSDGAATIKLYRGTEGEWLVLEGWLDPVDGRRDPYTDRLLLVTVRRIAPVIYVKRKL